MAAADAVRHHVAPTKRRLAAALKEELPLTPAQSQYSPKKKLKTVAFSEALTTDVLLHGRAFSPDAYEDPAGDDDDDAAGSLEHIIGLAAEVAIREAEHEQLSEADSTMRVEVPPIDHSLPDVPWSVDHTAFAGRRLFPNRDTSNEMMSMLLRCLDDNKACFPRSQLDRTVRVWEPFPLHLGNVSTNEILDDGSLERYLTKLEFASTKASIWKPEGLRILDEPDREDDGIEPLHVGLFQDTEVIVDDLQTRLRRHRSIARPKAHGAANMSHATDPPITEQEYIKQIAGHEVVPSSHGERRSSTLNGAFSAYASLGRFMQTQSSVPLSEDFNKGENQNSLPQDNPEAQSQPLAHDCTRTSCRPLVSAPTPAIAVRAASSLPAAQFILSSSLLSCRGLLRKVESRYPAAQFIDRDFDMRKPVYETTHPSSVDEGDLILSPSTGLMFTTLQHIKQKPLPGQTTHNGVLERIAELADRYERLFVLVSNGQSSNCTGDQQSHCLDERDCLGLASLYSSVARLNADVRILFVPDGEDALADWTVNCMAKYSAHEQANLLVQEETLWEVILRKAGLNTFAGQSILSKLKGTDCYVKALPTKLTKQSFGMTALVLMDTDERRTYLSSSMDGEKLLKHVSRAIDGIWRSPI
ncbi:hypothetical protein AAFC00_006905 [Neodothiora populina]|uniref:Uncharacterized protein n=1 Tax=Neodothiora populina TaxID=2781224 RepID=A0ABR3PCU9_9PEZI